MLFSGIVCDVSKSFQLKGTNGGNGIFFTVMKNNKGSAKYIKCLTSNSTLIKDLLTMSGSNEIYIIVKCGYPDTSYSKDYYNTKTQKEGVYLQHFVVTNAIVDMREIKEDDNFDEQEVIVKKSEKVDNDEAWADITKEEKNTFDWDWDLDEDTKENNENRQS